MIIFSKSPLLLTPLYNVYIHRCKRRGLLQIIRKDTLTSTINKVTCQVILRVT